ncbi:MAG: glycosyltransferase family 39 protein [Verrucomicrobiota bacterium]|nr:glycosyltransferase family 39 protein [Verrucomicrobiota bacterium]
MALRSLHGIRPSLGYIKPPLHTYLNHLLVIWPVDVAQALADRLTKQAHKFNELKLLGSRVVVSAMFLGIVALIYAIALRAFGRAPARVLALVAASSAGIVTYAHFLTCDVPLVFWMMLVFFFAQRITESGAAKNYLLAGFITGIATATKYNGLAIGFSIVVAHLLSSNYRGIRQALFDRRLVGAIAMIPVGFLVGNPCALLDRKQFVADFMYGYVVTPRYGGQSGVGYASFLSRLPEVIGWPVTIVVSIAVIASIAIVIARRDLTTPAARCLLLALGVFLLYFAKIGSFPRVETRFVLPIIPLLLLMAGPTLHLYASRPKILGLLLVPLLAYNAVCAWLVGQRFNDDPRLAAQEWVLAHVPPGSRIESSHDSPHWARLSGFDAADVRADNPKWEQPSGHAILDLRMGHLNGRAEQFEKMFVGNRWVENSAARYEGDPDQALFTRAERARRNPDFVAAHSSDYEVPSEIARSYYAELIEERANYTIVFDGRQPAAPTWAYPGVIDFVGGRMTILARR